MTIPIRPATASDSDAWLRLRHALWPEASESEHRAEIDRFFAGQLHEPLAVLLAEDGAGAVVGVAELSIRSIAEGCTSDRVAYLEGWFVVPEARRRGVGRALVTAAEQWGRDQGCTEFASDTPLDNLASAAAHRALGFVEVESIRCFRKDLLLFLIGFGAAALSIACRTVTAQEPAPVLQPGVRVRLTVLCAPKSQVAEQRAGCPSDGQLVMLRPDSITLATGDSTTRYALNAVSGFEVSRGYRSHWLAGAGAGLVAGAGLTFLLLNSGGSTSLCDQSANQDAMSSSECLGLTALGGAAGAGLGALIGGRVRTELWRDVPVERLRGAVKVGMVVAF